MADLGGRARAALKQVEQELINKKKAEEQKRINDQIQADAVARQRKFELEMADFRAERIVRRTKEGAVSDWDDLLQQIEGELGRNVTSVNDWRSAMLDLVNMLTKMVTALHNSVTETVYAPVFHQAKELLYHKLTDFIRARFGKSAEQVLPDLIHDVKLNDDGSLNVGLERSDEGEASAALRDAFKGATELWLAANGYTKDPANNRTFIYTNNDGAVPLGTALTADSFAELKTDPDKGLHVFLKEHSDLEYRAGPGMG